VYNLIVLFISSSK